MSGPLGATSIRSVVREVDGVADPLALYSALSCGGAAAGTFLLESGDAGEATGERSLVGCSCAIRVACSGQSVRVEAWNGNGRSFLPWIAGRLEESADVTRSGSSVRALFAERASPPEEEDGTRLLSPLDALRAVTLEAPCEDGSSEDLLLSGGIFSYDLVDLLEALPPGRPLPGQPPDFEFFLQDRLIVVDHRRGRTLLAAHALGGEHGELHFREAARDLDRLAAMVEIAGALPLPRRVTRRCSAPEAHPERSAVDLSDGEYASLVKSLHPHLERGDLYQIVPSRTFSTSCRDPLEAYAVLRARDPSPYLFYVRSPAQAVLGASPETCVKVTGHPRRMIVRPIAGTAARGHLPGGGLDPELDARRQAALLLDPKETAEHMMLVDLARNDVARVSRPGTRRVTRLLEVERYAHVMHLVSEVQGDLRDGLDAVDAYAAAMNPGTLVGAPKLRAARVLREVEPARRGVFGGAVGYLSRSGRMDTAIAIRTAVVRDGIASVRAGAGVVLDSSPAAEALETRRKAAAVLEAVMTAEACHG